MLQTFLVVIACGFFMGIANTHKEDIKDLDGNLILKFNKSLVNMFFYFNVFILVAMIVIAILGFGSGETENTLGILIIFFILLLFCSSIYGCLKKKKIIINGENITVFPIFGKAKEYTFESINKVKDYPGGSITLYMKNNTKFSIEYLMDNIINFKDILVARNIEIQTKKSGI